MALAAPVDVLRGVQTPRIECRPPWRSSTGPEAVELAASAGLMLDPWQAHAVDVFLAEDEAGRWAAFEAACIVPRQNGKGALAEALILADLFLLDTPLVIYSAHLFSTTAETFMRLVALIESADHLSRRVLRVARSTGKEAIELRSGARLRFLARSKASGRGFSSGKNYIDEAQSLSAQSMAAVVPTLTTADNPQLCYFGSAPLPDSDYLRAMRRRAVASPADRGRLALLEWSADPGSALDDRAAWAQANPALGYRVTEQYIADELATFTDAPEHFARERLGIVPEAQSASPVDLTAWEAAQDAASTVPDQAPVSFAVDVAPGGRSAAVVVAGRRADSRVHVEVVEHGAGTDWCVSTLRRLTDTWGGEVVGDPGGPAGAVLAQATAEGVAVRQVSGRDLAAVAAGFVAAVTAGDVAVRPHPRLTAAVEAARPRVAGDGAWTWTRRGTAADISPVVAASLAWWAATTLPAVDLLTSVW